MCAFILMRVIFFQGILLLLFCFRKCTIFVLYKQIFIEKLFYKNKTGKFYKKNQNKPFSKENFIFGTYSDVKEYHRKINFEKDDKKIHHPTYEFSDDELKRRIEIAKERNKIAITSLNETSSLDDILSGVINDLLN